VARGGYGLFYAGFENSSGLDHLGTNNYPFLFSFGFPAPDPARPIRPGNSIGLLENGLMNIPINPALVTAQQGFNSIGREYNFPTAYTEAVNLAFQYQLTPNQSIQAAYVGTFGRHLEITPGANSITEILPPSTNIFQYIPFPDFSPGFTYVTHEANSNYHSLQLTFERRFSQDFSFLADYTWSRCRTDARENLENTIGAYRAPHVPGFGIHGDYALCDWDVRNLFHLSGIYELPVGNGKRFFSHGASVVDALVGGWSANWILTLQDGQPLTVPCNVTPAAGVGCYALLVAGQNPTAGPHNVNQWMNPAAFTNPPVASSVGQSDLAPLGGAPTQLVGPGFHRLDVSLFKQIKTSEKTYLQIRAEFFNLTNHPNFANPTSPNLDFSSPAFGAITATRDSPNDPRQIQFALKFYW
jgi:hypothetical protein